MVFSDTPTPTEPPTELPLPLTPMETEPAKANALIVLLSSASRLTTPSAITVFKVRGTLSSMAARTVLVMVFRATAPVAATWTDVSLPPAVSDSAAPTAVPTILEVLNASSSTAPPLSTVLLSMIARVWLSISLTVIEKPRPTPTLPPEPTPIVNAPDPAAASMLLLS